MRMAEADTNRLFEVIGELRGMLQSLLARTESIETEVRRSIDGAHARMDKIDEKIGALGQRVSTLEAGQNVAKGGLLVGRSLTIALWTLLTGAASLLAWFAGSGLGGR